MEESKVETDLKEADPSNTSALVELMNERVNDIKDSCKERIDNLEKKVTRLFKISIAISIAVLIAYTSLPPDTVKTLVETICNLLAK